MTPTKRELRTVSLEATVVVRSINFLTWRESNLSPLPSRVKIVVVGHDYCLFKERLAYLIAESKVRIQERHIDVVGYQTVADAMSVFKNKEVVLVILLKSVLNEWDEISFINRSGLIVYGQGEAYKRSEVSLCSNDENNRLRMSINRRKLEAVGVEIANRLVLLNPTLYFYN